MNSKRSKFYYLLGRALDEIQMSKEKGKRYTFHINWLTYISAAEDEAIDEVEVYAALKLLLDRALEHKVDLLFFSLDKSYIQVGKS